MKSNSLLIYSPFVLSLRRGTENFSKQLVKYFMRKNYRVFLLTWSGEKDILAELKEDGLNLLIIPKVRYFQALFSVPFIVWYVLKLRIDHLFITFVDYGEGWAIRILRKLQRCPHITIRLNIPFTVAPHRYHTFERHKVGFSNETLIACSQYYLEQAQDFFGRRIRKIPCAVDVDYYNPTLQKNKRRVLTLVTVSSLDARKGVQHIIRSLGLVQEEIRNRIRLKVVGDGPLMQSLQDEVTGLGLCKYVEFLGIIREVKDVLLRSDVFVMLAEGEGFPNSMLEAMAMELPVVVSIDDPFPEIVDDSYGWIVDKKDYNRIAVLFSNIVSHPEVVSEKGKKARQVAESQYSIETVFSHYYRLFYE